MTCTCFQYFQCFQTYSQQAIAFRGLCLVMLFIYVPKWVFTFMISILLLFETGHWKTMLTKLQLGNYLWSGKAVPESYWLWAFVVANIFPGPSNKSSSIVILPVLLVVLVSFIFIVGCFYGRKRKCRGQHLTSGTRDPSTPQQRANVFQIWLLQ